MAVDKIHSEPLLQPPVGGPYPDAAEPFLPSPDPAPALPYDDLEPEPAAPSPASISFGLIEGWF